MKLWHALLLLALRTHHRSPEPRAREIGRAGAALLEVLKELAGPIAAEHRERDLAEDLAHQVWEKVWLRPESFLPPLDPPASREEVATIDGIERWLAPSTEGALDAREAAARAYLARTLRNAQTDRTRKEARREKLRKEKMPPPRDAEPSDDGAGESARIDARRAEAAIQRAAQGVAGWDTFVACSDGQRTVESMVHAELASMGEHVEPGAVAVRHPHWKKVRARIDKRNQRARDAVLANVGRLEREGALSAEEAVLARQRVQTMLLNQRAPGAQGEPGVRSAPTASSSRKGSRS